MPNLNEFGYLLGEKTSLKKLFEGLLKHLYAMPLDVQAALAKEIKGRLKREQKKMNSAASANRKPGSKKAPERLSDLPRHLHGLPSNKYGGNQLQILRGFRGGSYGPVKKTEA